jgi:hypothetical protein
MNLKEKKNLLLNVTYLGKYPKWPKLGYSIVQTKHETPQKYNKFQNVAKNLNVYVYCE